MKCKACGFNDSVKYNPKKRIVSLLSERTEKTRKILRNVINKIKKIPSQSDVNKQFYFLQAISNIDEQIIQLSVHQFISDERHPQGKGFEYLKKMITQINEDKDRLLELEVKKYGRTPTKKEVKKKEYTNVYSRNRRKLISRQGSTS